MKTIHLHVGTMKTGTSTVQAFLAANRAALAAHHGLDAAAWPMRRSAAIAEFVAAHAASPNDMIVSDEGLWHFALTSKSDTRGVADALQGLRVRIVVYFRRPDLYLESCYLQGLKSGGTRMTFDAYRRDAIIRRSAQYRRSLGAFEELFGRAAITVRPYERAQLAAGDVVSDLWAVLGRDPAALPTRPADANETPNKAALLLGLLARAGAGNPAAVHAALRETLFDRSAPSRGSILAPAERAALLAAHRDECAAVARDFAPDGPPLLFADWPEQFDGPPDPEHVVRRAVDAALRAAGLDGPAKPPARPARSAGATG